MKIINCHRCWKEIEQKWPRVYCIPCRKIIDKEVAYEYRQKHKEGIKERERKYAKEKRDRLKWEE